MVISADGKGGARQWSVSGGKYSGPVGFIGKSKGKGAPDSQQQPAVSDRLLISGLPPYMTDELLEDVFGSFGTLVEVKVLEDAKASDDGSLESVALVQMSSQAEATALLTKCNGEIPDGLMEPVSVKYEGAGEEKKSRAGSGHTIYVGDLPADMDEDTFVSICGMKGTLLQAKVFASRNCGYATYATEQEAQLAVEIVNGFEHHGAKLSARPADGALPFEMLSGPSKPDPNMMRPHTNKLYIRGLKAGITEEEVLEVFTPHGAVEDVRILFSDEYTGTGAMVYMGSHWKAGELVRELDGIVLPGYNNPLRVKLADTPEEFSKRKAAQAAWEAKTAGAQAAPGSADKNESTEKDGPEAAEEDEETFAMPAKKPRVDMKAPPRLRGMESSTEPQLRVDGLPESADEWYLVKAFAKFGTLAGVEVSRNALEECSGSGYIKFMLPSGSEKAVAASGSPAPDGSVLDVWPRWMAEPDEAVEA